MPTVGYLRVGELVFNRRLTSFLSIDLPFLGHLKSEENIHRLPFSVKKMYILKCILGEAAFVIYEAYDFGSI